MNPIKIFAFPTHCTKDVTPGVDYVRMVLPMKELQKDPRFIVTIFDQNMNLAKLDWREVAKEYDILYINYLTLPWDFALIGMLFRKEGKKIVFDIDDLIWEIQDDNSSYQVYAPGSEGRKVVTSICKEADYVTCTNNYLKNGISRYTLKNHDRIQVFPNYIDLDLYSWRAKPIKKSSVRIGYFGSSSHFNDLADKNFVEGVEKLMKEFPNVELYTIGAMIQQFKRKFGMRYTTGFGHQDIFTWVKMFPEKLEDVDIFAVPLVETTYCRAKSSVKFLEMSSTTKPGVWQNIRQYQETVEHGKNGFLATTADDWYSSIKKLVESSELRQKMGQEAFNTIERNWQMKSHREEYVKFFAKVVDRQLEEV